jgi:integrase
MARGRPKCTELVFPDSEGGFLRRQNWRQRVWKKTLEAAQDEATKSGLAKPPYFRPYDLRHTAATLLIYEGRPVTEVAEHLGHADPGFTARVYAHAFKDGRDRRHVPLVEAIAAARRTAGAAMASGSYGNLER